MKKKDTSCVQELLKAYTESNLVCFGSPDQFQYRQNNLIQMLAEYIIERDELTSEENNEDE